MSLKNKKLYIVLESGKTIGLGHLSRCIALATEILNRNLNVKVFLLHRTDLDLNLNNKSILERHFSNTDSWEKIIEEVEVGSVVLIDSYSFNVNNEQYLNSKNCKLVVIDDLGRSHDAQVVIDQNVGSDESVYRKTELNSNTQYLIGPKFAIIRDEFKLKFENIHQNIFDSLLIYLGSAKSDYINKLILISRELNFKKTTVLSSNSDLVTLQCNENQISHSTNIAQLYNASSIVFGACGVSQLERYCMNVPTIPFVVAENQLAIGNAILKLSQFNYVGNFLTVQTSISNQCISEAIRNIDKFVKIEVDALGKKLICSKIEDLLYG